MSEQIEGQKKLRECPFCGGEAEARYLPVNGSPGNELYGLCGCNPCDVTFFSADKFVKGQEMEAIAQAVELWNTRRSPDKRLRELVEFVKAIAEMTEGNGRITEKSVIEPGVTIKTKASRLIALLQATGKAGR